MGLKFHMKAFKNNNDEQGISPENALDNEGEAFITKYINAIKSITGECPDISIITVWNESDNITWGDTYKEYANSLITQLQELYPNTLIGGSTHAEDYLQYKSNNVEIVDFFGCNLYSGVPYDVPTYLQCCESLGKIMKDYDGQLNSTSIKERLGHLCERTNKKYLITEVGVAPYETSARSPGDYVVTGKTKNNEVQINYLRANYNFYVRDPNCMGICLFTIGGTIENIEWFKDDELYNNVKDMFGGVDND